MPTTYDQLEQDYYQCRRELTAEQQREQDMSNALDIAISEHRCKCDELTAANERIRKLEAERKEMFGGSKRDIATKLQQQIAKTTKVQRQLTAERAISDKLKNTLEFYADETMFTTHLQGDHENPDMVVPVAEDQGDIARAALAELATLKNRL